MEDAFTCVAGASLRRTVKRNCRASTRAATAAVLTVIAAAGLAAPAAAVSRLGSAADYAVLAATAVSNTGPTAIVGNIGVSPGLAITGGSTITQVGTIHAGDALATQAQADARTAFDGLVAMPSGTDMSGVDLGGRTLTPGTYSFATSAQLTGDLLLDFTSNPGGSFVFRVGTTLTTGAGSNVFVLGGNSGSGIFWSVGTSATVGINTAFAGTIIADQSITLNTAASIICGRAIALVAAVSMDSNSISNNCGGSGHLGTGRSDFGSSGFIGGAYADPTPEPATWAMLVIGFGFVGYAMRRRVAKIVHA